MVTYATCKTCHKEMGIGVSCRRDRTVLRWGEGETTMDVTWPCHDCNVTPGQWHHEGCALKFDRKTGEQVFK